MQRFVLIDENSFKILFANVWQAPLGLNVDILMEVEMNIPYLYVMWILYVCGFKKKILHEQFSGGINVQ